MDSLLTSKFKLGGDTSIALGPWAAEPKSDVTADFFRLPSRKGSTRAELDGSYIDVRESLNKVYYGKAVTPWTSSSSNRSATRADPLREELKKTK